MNAWEHLCRDFMVSVSHPKAKPDVDDSKRKQCVQVTAQAQIF